MNQCDKPLFKTHRKFFEFVQKNDEEKFYVNNIIMYNRRIIDYENKK